MCKEINLHHITLKVPENPFLHGGKLSLGRHLGQFSTWLPKKELFETELTNDPAHFCWAYIHISVVSVFLFHHPQHSNPLISPDFGVQLPLKHLLLSPILCVPINNKSKQYTQAQV